MKLGTKLRENQGPRQKSGGYGPPRFLLRTATGRMEETVNRCKATAVHWRETSGEQEHWLIYCRWLKSDQTCSCNVYHSVAYAETFHGGGFIQRHRVVVCIWCALFVMSQNDVTVLFPNQRFGEVCWHNIHIFLYTHSSYSMCQCTEYKLLELKVRLSEENTYTQCYDTTVRNCKKYQEAR